MSSPTHTSIWPAFKALCSLHSVPGILPALRGSTQLCLQPLQFLGRNSKQKGNSEKKYPDWSIAKTKGRKIWERDR
jgi:hypothetical protein